MWALFVAAFAFLYYRYAALWGTGLTQLATSSAWLAYTVYLALGAVRGFALLIALVCAMKDGAAADMSP